MVVREETSKEGQTTKCGYEEVADQFDGGCFSQWYSLRWRQLWRAHDFMRRSRYIFFSWFWVSSRIGHDEHQIQVEEWWEDGKEEEEKMNKWDGCAVVEGIKWNSGILDHYSRPVVITLRAFSSHKWRWRLFLPPLSLRFTQMSSSQRFWELERRHWKKVVKLRFNKCMLRYVGRCLAFPSSAFYLGFHFGSPYSTII